MTAERSLWQLESNQAVAQLGPVALLLQCDQPALGVVPFYGSVSTKMAVLGVRTPGAPECEVVVDRYVRQSDLVLTYEETPPRTVRPQLYWRLLPQGEASVYGIELVLSVQTSLLESQPQTQIVSRLMGTDSIQWLGSDGSFHTAIGKDVAVLERDGAQPLVLARLRGMSMSYVEMAYPSDFLRLQIQNPGKRDPQLSWSLFDEHLEKGVIRRARLRGVFIPTDNDEAIARQQYEQFVNSELPLTT